MVQIRGFRALRPMPKEAAQIAALPYDVYSREEARREIESHPLSFLRIDLPEAMMAPKEAYGDRNRRARRELDAMVAEGHFYREEVPGLYIYELEREGRRQKGLVCLASVAEYENGTIRRHEKTRRKKEADRVDHIRALNAQTGPIFLAYLERDEIRRRIDEESARPPEIEFTTDDKVVHRIWSLRDSDTVTAIENLFRAVPSMYIADGHHRCAAAARVAAETEKENAGFLAILFSHRDLQVYDYNRVVADLGGLSERAFFEKLGAHFAVIEAEGPLRPAQKATFGMYTGGRWYRLEFTGQMPRDPVAALDVSLLQDNVLGPILGIDDPRTSERIDFVGGVRGMEALERRVDAGMAVAFSLYPTALEELMDVADAGRVMPPKSTWFEPKPRSGLFIHELR
ncbi:Uncharacterized conserved protein [Aedoeadaptatus ivorii]|uniref:Uncharacterized conserved protein n=1 Tax=Aedoeadaptatus ivorii TaxID=54006 RepID=A0A448V075_9FIRM|nr:DUF1015 family protein [Peptoniphilus ivorii]VEJ34680.1 Uncharacterized conserved protein [Peptoniphilus ivorii]